MCGIVGWYDVGNGGGTQEANLRTMCDLLEHRGPDDSGYFISDNVALGIRRLSIVDPALGHQPVRSDDQEVQVVFNGEIYNHGELRAELASVAEFHTLSDSEVLLRAYEAWGIEALSRFNGMFAIAIWDGRKQTLFLARDRAGVKPLYYHWDGYTCSFASELKALLPGLKQKPSLNLSAVSDYLTFRYVPMDNCIWDNVSKLAPGHYIELSPREPRPVERRWWKLPNNATQIAADHAFEDFSNLLDSAVNLRMQADVPVGILLSGGLDSSVIAALANKHHPSLSTFSVGFKGEEDANELAHARVVAEHLGADHHELEIGLSDFCDYLPKMVFDCDEPLADLASVPLYHITKLASGSVKVLLSGEGSDEIMAGYNFDALVSSWSSEAQTPNRIWDKLARLLGTQTRQEPDMRNEDFPPAMTNYMTQDEKWKLMRWSGAGRESQQRIVDLYQNAGRRGALDQVLYAYCQDWLVEDLLMKADKTSMANSVEVRTPFLDYRFLELCFSLPMSSKVGQREGTFVTKRMLRDLGDELLPSEIVRRPKQGFPVPAYRWLRNELKEWGKSVLLDNSARINDICDRAELARLVDYGLNKQSPIVSAHIVWNLLILELWLQRWSR